ncbi:MAG: CpsD/CapB family tyrosine-protein kinase [Desulfobulbaceae bacterium]|nr:CpsD/CapB family tyrosine-protein kinase [Desulfobulbaceae bacterium]
MKLCITSTGKELEAKVDNRFGREAYHEKPFRTPVIGVTGGKGGVGKTMVAVNIACALADMGHRVALVDAPNASAPSSLALGRLTATLYERINGQPWP